MISTSKNERVYEPPKAKIYRFDDNEQILTSSNTGGGGGGVTPTPTPTPTVDYAARALNELMGGTNTTME